MKKTVKSAKKDDDISYEMSKQLEITKNFINFMEQNETNSDAEKKIIKSNFTEIDNLLILISKEINGLYKLREQNKKNKHIENYKICENEKTIIDLIRKNEDVILLLISIKQRIIHNNQNLTKENEQNQKEELK